MNNQKRLGFSWDPTIIPKTPLAMDVRRVCFRVRKLFPEFVWDTTMLEDNPFTFPEVKTLLDGITVGGHKLSDEQQVLNQAESWNYLLTLVQNQQFVLNKKIFCELNAIVAKEEGLTWGIFRDGAVLIAGTSHQPPHFQQLEMRFKEGLQHLLTLKNPLEQGLAFFLFGALHQFFYDGNKRTSRLMMNGVLLIHGLNAISIPAREKQAFNEKMVRFYEEKDGTEIFEFLLKL
ncbi:MAG: Fic family protein [Gammaproteobacteria bacterium]|nr:Fic family protein [Gammaproteobacteria bacterium]